MGYFPLNWQKINISNGLYTPSTIKKHNNKAFWFWERCLFQRAASVIELEIPWEGAVRDFFTWVLYRRGFVCVWDDPEFGFTFQPCNLAGYDFYYLPARAIVTNPLLKTSKEMKIGEECCILKLSPDYMGIWDIINYYAEKLANLDNAINVSIINNKFTFVLGAKNRAMAAALKEMMDLINQGDPAVIFDRRIFPMEKDSEPWQFLERQNLKQSYLTDMQLADMHTLLNDFDAQIGIPALPYEKKERMVTDEANSKVMESQARCMIWVETLNQSAIEIKKLYGKDLKFSLKFEPEGGLSDGYSKDNTAGDGELRQGS